MNLAHVWMWTTTQMLYIDSTHRLPNIHIGRNSMRAAKCWATRGICNYNPTTWKHHKSKRIWVINWWERAKNVFQSHHLHALALYRPVCSSVLYVRSVHSFSLYDHTGINFDLKAIILKVFSTLARLSRTPQRESARIHIRNHDNYG